jgi:hypothetical protein
VSDEQFDEAPKKKDTKGSKRPKRDPNQPFPKAKGGLLKKVLLLAVSGVVVIVVTWAGIYSAQIGKLPHEWSEADQQGFADYSKSQLDEAKKNVESVDWNALKDKITETTKQLWDDVPKWEQKLDAKVAQLRGDRAPATTTAPKPATTTGAAPSTEAAPPAAAVPAEASEFEKGCVAMKDAIAVYRKSVNSQAELKRAQAKFHVASKHFEKAHAEAEAKKDEPALLEIEGYMQQCNMYLIDCSKRMKV